jgi:HEAT repeat protein
MAALKDAFWGVQAEAAGALAEIRTDAARDALIAAASVPHPKARRAVAKALGSFNGGHDAPAVATLRALAERDPSYFVEAEATQAWVRAQARPGARDVDAEGIEKLIRAQLRKESFNDVIRASALRALGELPGLERGERESALRLLEEWSARGRSDDARIACVTVLGKVARAATPAVRARALGLLDAMADEDNFRLRMALVAALGASESPDAIPTLEKIRARDLDGRVKRDALAARDALHAAGSTPESVSALRRLVERLEEEQRKLRAQVEEMKAGLKA